VNPQRIGPACDVRPPVTGSPNGTPLTVDTGRQAASPNRWRRGAPTRLGRAAALLLRRAGYATRTNQLSPRVLPFSGRPRVLESRPINLRSSASTVSRREGKLSAASSSVGRPNAEVRVWARCHFPGSTRLIRGSNVLEGVAARLAATNARFSRVYPVEFAADLSLTARGRTVCVDGRTLVVLAGRPSSTDDGLSPTKTGLSAGVDEFSPA
jgi:hypothetical protein